MRIAASAVLVGAASASILSPLGSGQQHVLGDSITKPAGSLDKIAAAAGPLAALQEAVKGLTADAEELWEDVKRLVPESFEKSSFFSSPKKHTRRPDSHWDHIVKGADVPKAFVTTASGSKSRDSLDAYNLRVKAVDPSGLGIDKVKQYSGYLDDDENDKHLFYCTLSPCQCVLFFLFISALLNAFLTLEYRVL